MKTTLKLLVIVVGLVCGGDFAVAQSWNAIANLGAPVVVASSADGAKLVLAYNNWWKVYTSTNFGKTWILTSTPTANWRAVASSADGTKLVTAAGVGKNGETTAIYTSTDSGATWAASHTPSQFTGANWWTVASSADGNKLVAAISGGGVYSSDNSGLTWAWDIAPDAYWQNVVSSADGNKLAAVDATHIYLSTNSGATWNIPAGASNIVYPAAIASSADGSKLVVGTQYSVFTSSDSGATWIQTSAPTGSDGRWTRVASSADGSKLVAGGYNNAFCIYTSTDSGVTWVSNNLPNIEWHSLAMSADGSKLVAAATDGEIYTWQYAPALSATCFSSNLVVSWPDSAYTNIFTLQTNSDLTTTNWADVGLLVNDDGTNKSVTFSAPTSNLFFRLRSP